MSDILNSKPVTFDHPEKLTEGVTLEKGSVVAKAFINEEDGCVKSNIVIENRATGEVSKKDAVIGEIVDNVEDEDIDSDDIIEY